MGTKEYPVEMCFTGSFVKVRLSDWTDAFSEVEEKLDFLIEATLPRSCGKVRDFSGRVLLSRRASLGGLSSQTRRTVFSGAEFFGAMFQSRRHRRFPGKTSTVQVMFSSICRRKVEHLTLSSEKVMCLAGKLQCGENNRFRNNGVWLLSG